ncbi:MAG: DUF5752 family protein, partial [Candidatus Hermodarchaeia archaeon]
THSYFLRHYYIAGAYSNDFANWAAIQVRDRVLGEKLAVVTPSGEKSLEDIQSDLIDIIDIHLSSISIVPRVVYGNSFYFMQSRIIEVPTGVIASNFKEFYENLKIVDGSAVYNHVFEGRLRDRQGRSDFALWFQEALNMKELAHKCEMIDSYMYTLEGLRRQLLDLCKQELGNG